MAVYLKTINVTEGSQDMKRDNEKKPEEKASDVSNPRKRKSQSKADPFSREEFPDPEIETVGSSPSQPCATSNNDIQNDNKKARIVGR